MSSTKQPADLSSEWSNDVRMNALFAPLQNKDLNPESWNAKILFWINLIERWSSENSVAILDVSELKHVFERNGKIPHCLPDIIEEAVVRRKFFPPDVHLQNIGVTHQTWGSWAVSLGTSAVKSLGSKVIGTRVSSFTVPNSIEKMEKLVTEQILQHSKIIQGSQFNYIEDKQLETILNEIKHQHSREYTLKVLKQKRTLVQLNIENRVFYKIIESDKSTKIDELDKGILHLKVNLERIEREIETLENRIKEEKIKAKKSLQEGSKSAAKSCLKRKKRLDGNLEQLLSQQLNLEKIYEDIMQAESNKTIHQAYESGLAAMKTMVDSSMIDKTHATMSELAELLDMNQEISDAMVMKDNAEIGDLEADLQDLLDEEHENLDDIARDKQTPETNFQIALDNLEKCDIHDLEPVIGKKETKNLVTSS